MQKLENDIVIYMNYIFHAKISKKMLKVLFHTLPGQLTVLSISFMLFMMGYLFFYVMRKVKEASKK